MARMIGSAFETRVYRVPAALIVAVFVTSFSAAQRVSPDFLHRMLDAHGGLERFRSLTTWRIVAKRNLFRRETTEHEQYEEYLLHEDSRLMTLLVKRR